jgi:hypothetical protein
MEEETKQTMDKGIVDGIDRPITFYEKKTNFKSMGSS